MSQKYKLHWVNENNSKDEPIWFGQASHSVNDENQLHEENACIATRQTADFMRKKCAYAAAGRTLNIWFRSLWFTQRSSKRGNKENFLQGHACWKQFQLLGYLLAKKVDGSAKLPTQVAFCPEVSPSWRGPLYVDNLILGISPMRHVEWNIPQLQANHHITFLLHISSSNPISAAGLERFKNDFFPRTDKSLPDLHGRYWLPTLRESGTWPEKIGI